VKNLFARLKWTSVNLILQFFHQTCLFNAQRKKSLRTYKNSLETGHFHLKFNSEKNSAFHSFFSLLTFLIKCRLISYQALIMQLNWQSGETQTHNIIYNNNNNIPYQFPICRENININERHMRIKEWRNEVVGNVFGFWGCWTHFYDMEILT